MAAKDAKTPLQAGTRAIPAIDDRPFKPIFSVENLRAESDPRAREACELMDEMRRNLAAQIAESTEKALRYAYEMGEGLEVNLSFMHTKIGRYELIVSYQHRTSPSTEGGVFYTPDAIRRAVKALEEQGADQRPG